MKEKLQSMMTSKTDEWETPEDVYDELNKIYQFTLDPAATKENAKCKHYYTKEQNGLIQPWNGIVFCNPPYGRKIGDWVRKGYEESKRGNIVVMLLPARTDTKWFHEYCTKGKITFIYGRLKFGNSKNPAPFPSMVVEFK